MKKKIVIDIGHPGQVHQFKYIYAMLVQSGYEVLFTAKEKEMTIELLDNYGMPYHIIGKSKNGLLIKILNIPYTCFKFYKTMLEYKPDIILSRFSFHASWISFLVRKSHIGFTDTEHVNFADILTVPFVNVKLTSTSYKKNLGKNHFRYAGNTELYYLHQNRFTPNHSIFELLGLKRNEKYAVIRFVSWNAHHDVGQTGLTLKDKIKLVEELSQKIKVFITSEKEIPYELKKYELKTAPKHIHSVLKFADLYVGEGATMASEAAVLGTPSIYINSLSLGYLDEQIKSGILFHYRNSELAIKKAIELANDRNSKSKISTKVNRYLNGKVDVTSFIVWFIKTYPSSINILKENPGYQFNFK